MDFVQYEVVKLETDSRTTFIEGIPIRLESRGQSGSPSDDQGSSLTIKEDP